MREVTKRLVEGLRHGGSWHERVVRLLRGSDSGELREKYRMHSASFDPDFQPHGMKVGILKRNMRL